MAVTLLWIRDNYDADKSRYINVAEKDNALVDWKAGTITLEEMIAVQDAYFDQTLLPAYDGGGILFSSVPSGANITFTEV